MTEEIKTTSADGPSRRTFLQAAAATPAVFDIVPRHVLGGKGYVAPSDTLGGFGASRSKGNILTHKIMRSGLLKNCEAVHIKRGGFKVKEWSGRADLKPAPVPKNLDWEMYVGPSPMKPFVPARFGGTHR